MTLQVSTMQAEVDYRRDRLEAEFQAQQARREMRQLRRRHTLRLRRRNRLSAAGDRITVAVR
jgi:hypothetical protein